MANEEKRMVTIGDDYDKVDPDRLSPETKKRIARGIAKFYGSTRKSAAGNPIVTIDGEDFEVLNVEIKRPDPIRHDEAAVLAHIEAAVQDIVNRPPIDASVFEAEPVRVGWTSPPCQHFSGSKSDKDPQ